MKDILVQSLPDGRGMDLSRNAVGFRGFPGWDANRKNACTPLLPALFHLQFRPHRPELGLERWKQFDRAGPIGRVAYALQLGAHPRHRLRPQISGASLQRVRRPLEQGSVPACKRPLEARELPVAFLEEEIDEFRQEPGRSGDLQVPKLSDHLGVDGRHGSILGGGAARVKTSRQTGKNL